MTHIQTSPCVIYLNFIEKLQIIMFKINYLSYRFDLRAAKILLKHARMHIDTKKQTGANCVPFNLRST